MLSDMKLTLLEHPTASTAREFPSRLNTRLEELKGELNASIKFEGLSPGGWAIVSIAGEDSEIMSELTQNEFPVAPTESDVIKLQDNLPAEIVGSNPNGLKVDIGLGTKLQCLIPTSNLNAQLADGKALPLRQLMECYCLHPGVRVCVRVTEMNDYEMKAWLADGCTDTIGNWVKTGLDRIQVLECFKKDTERAVLKAHLSRDILAVDSMTLTTQSIVCKLGTDGIGLMPKLGRFLREQPLKPFQPRKIVSRCRPW